MKSSDSESKDIPEVNNLMDFLVWVKNLGNDEFIYRGQADEAWPLRSGATRRICGTKKDDPINYSKVQEYVEDLIDKTKAKELHKYNNDHDLNCDLKILAELQHFGAATPLIDFSRNSLIALWVACCETEQAGKVLAINTTKGNNIEYISNDQQNNGSKFSDFLKEFIDPMSGDNFKKIWLWEPSHFNKRIPAQSSVFLLSKEPYDHLKNIESIIIAKSAKEEILKQLESMFGIKEDTVYPDFTGFTKANNFQKNYISKDAEDYYREGIKLFQANKYPEAISAFNKVFDFHNVKTELLVKTYEGRGNAKYKQVNIDGAIEDYKNAVCLWEKCKELPRSFKSFLYNELGTLELEKQRYENAVEYLDMAILCDTNNYRPYSNRGVAKYNQNDIAGAIENYDKAITLKADFVIAYLNRGISKQAIEKYDDALKDYDKAIELKPDYALAYFNRGNCKRDKKDFPGAIQDYNKAIEIDSKYVEAYVNRGFAKEDNNDNAGAFKDYDKAIEINPYCYNAYNNRGILKLKLNNKLRAIKDFEKAIEIDPACELAKQKLKVCFLNNNQIQYIKTFSTKKEE